MLRVGWVDPPDAVGSCEPSFAVRGVRTEPATMPRQLSGFVNYRHRAGTFTGLTSSQRARESRSLLRLLLHCVPLFSLALIAANGRPASGAPPADVPGIHDDMPASERTASLLAAKLKKLAEILLDKTSDDSLDELVHLDARATSLRPDHGDTVHLTGLISVDRLPKRSLEEGPIVDSLRAFSRWLGDGQEKSRLYFKIVGISRSASNDWTADVRVEAVRTQANRIEQLTALWQIKFDLLVDGSDLRISRVALVTSERTASPRPLFEDSTRSLFSVNENAIEQLARGSEFWFGRLDAVGESQFMGHNGLAVGDVNGDNLDDLYIALGTGLPNKLLVQQPDGSVEDRAVEANVAWLDDTKGVTFADLDNDGDQDLVLSMGPSVVICVNDGAGVFGRFVNVRAPTPAAFYSLALADYDLDGDLDIYGCRYVKVRYGSSVPIPFHDANNGPRNLLIRNDGGHRYSDATAESGLDVNNARFSTAAAWADYDNDGDPDLYVANDFGRNNLYRNVAGHFTDVADSTQTQDQAAGMGVSWSDFDNDGDLDLHVSNMFSSAGRRVTFQEEFQRSHPPSERDAIRRLSLGNSLFQNQNGAPFSDRSDSAGIRMGRWAWGRSIRRHQQRRL